MSKNEWQVWCEVRDPGSSSWTGRLEQQEEKKQRELETCKPSFSGISLFALLRFTTNWVRDYNSWKISLCFYLRLVCFSVAGKRVCYWSEIVWREPLRHLQDCERDHQVPRKWQRCPVCRQRTDTTCSICSSIIYCIPYPILNQIIGSMIICYAIINSSPPLYYVDKAAQSVPSGGWILWQKGGHHSRLPPQNDNFRPLKGRQRGPSVWEIAQLLHQGAAWNASQYCQVRTAQ